MVHMGHKLALNARQRHLYLPLSDHRTQGEFFRHFLLQDQCDWGMQDELGRLGTLVQGKHMSWGQAKGGGMDIYCFLGLLLQFPSTIYIYIFSLPRKAAPSKLVLPIWLWKAPQKHWLQQPQLTISTFVLSCLFAAKTAAHREFDFRSLLLKSHSATFAYGRSYFLSNCLGGWHKIIRQQKVSKILYYTRSLLTGDTVINNRYQKLKDGQSGITSKLMLKRLVLFATHVNITKDAGRRELCIQL